jgi:hypothetical protein
MSEPATTIPVSVSASGYEDGLGRRALEFDRETGVMLERLHLRPELGAFETFLRERVARAGSFDDERFARVRRVERDSRNVLTVVSHFVTGNRLCDLLEAATNLPADEATSPSVDAALGFLMEILPALGSLHEASRHAHGTLEPGRIVLTHDGRVVILDSVFGQAIERLQFNRRRLWLELGIATPAAAGPARLDIAGDIAQASLIAMMIVLSRPLRENEYPDAISTLLTEVIEIAQIRGSSRFASGLQAFLARTLPLPARRPHATAEEAAADVRQVAREIGLPRCRAALTAFIADMNRVLADTRERMDRVPSSDMEEATAEAMAAEDLPLDIQPSAEDTIPDAEAFASLASRAAAVPTETPLPDLQEADVAVAYETSGPVDGPEVIVEPALSEEPPLGIEPMRSPPIEPEPVPELVVAVLPEPVSVEPEPVPMAVAIAPKPEPVFMPAAIEPEPPSRTIVEPEPIPVPVTIASKPEPVFVPAAIQPEPPPPTIAAIEPVPSPEPVVVKRTEPPPAPPSKRKRRGSKPHRDKLRSNAVPKPTPPVMPMPAPLGPGGPAQTYGKASEPLRQQPQVPIQIAPIQTTPPAIVAKAPAPLRLKAEAPAGYNPGPRGDWGGASDVTAIPYVQRGAPDSSGGGFPKRLAAAGVIMMIIIIGAGRMYLARHAAIAEEMPLSIPAPVVKPVEVPKVGSIALTTQPAGAHVLLDGKAVGDSPLTLTDVAAGKHTLTLVTTVGSVKKTLRVEVGKTATLDVPIYSGWIAVFSPVPLDIAENGRAIGTTEQGRLMLSPGLHQLTLTNKQLGYKGVQIVDIEPGEERSISVQPTGELNVNAVPWAEVWMNDKKVGETPVAGLQVPLGTHEIVFKNPQFPERRVTVTVSAKSPVAASVDFSK